MRRPSIKSPCVADRHHSPGERIAEITFPDGSGCLVSVRVRDGHPTIQIYRADPTIRVSGPWGEDGQKVSAP